MFKYESSTGHIVNEKGKIVEVQGNGLVADQENRNIGVTDSKSHELKNQWDITYVKDMEAELKTGALNKDFGLKIGTDFHIVTKMGSGRYVDLISNNLVIKTPNSFKSQVWYFDNKSKTIKSRRSQYSIGIQSSGSASNLAIYRTTSRWW
jgi:hypothetical protein